MQQNWRGWLQEALSLGQVIFKLPGQLDQVLTQAQRGSLTLQTSLAPDARKTVQRLEQAVNRLSWMVVAAALLLAGVQLQSGSAENPWGVGLMILALAAFLWGIVRRN
ncbi:MAG: hypothetical protein HC875_01285 [Anaerolineales bacterium]|nr:hypothetical protein [Anaerolineales bacterium]